MKIKRLLAAMAATAVSVSAFSAMTISSANAATKIPYTASSNSLSTDNDGISLRRNILNVWTTPQVSDISENTTVEECITVDFTVSGIGDASALDDGTQFYAWLAGSIGSNPQVWTLADAGDNKVAINGDGDYTVQMPLAEGSDSISCLILQTNINLYAFGEGLEKTTANLTIKEIRTGAEEQPATQGSTENSTDATTGAATTTTAASNNSSAATTTTAASNSSNSSNSNTSSDSSSKETKDGKNNSTKAANGGTDTKSSNTGDAGVGGVVSVLTLAAATAFMAKKKN